MCWRLAIWVSKAAVAMGWGDRRGGWLTGCRRVGYAGLQKGLLIWYTSSVDAPVPVKAEKLPKQPTAAAPSTPPSAAAAAATLATAAYPTPATPSLDTLSSLPPTTPLKAEPNLPPIPATSSLTHAALRARLAGNKVKGGMYLTGREMEDLTEQWRPYRSVAMWYMWSLVDG